MVHHVDSRERLLYRKRIKKILIFALKYATRPFQFLRVNRMYWKKTSYVRKNPVSIGISR